MSADNGIYILKTKRTALETSNGCWTNRIENYVYRVAHAQAMDNLSYYQKNQSYNLGAYMHSVWSDSKVYTDEKSALEDAYLMEKDYSYLEYGIQIIDMSEYIFWGDL